MPAPGAGAACFLVSGLPRCRVLTARPGPASSVCGRRPAVLLPGCAATALPMARLRMGHLGQQELGSVQVKESIPHMGMLDRPDYLHFSQQEACVRPVRPLVAWADLSCVAQTAWSTCSPAKKGHVSS